MSRAIDKETLTGRRRSPLPDTNLLAAHLSGLSFPQRKRDIRHWIDPPSRV